MKRDVVVVGGGAIVRRAHLPALKLLEREGLVRLAAVVEPDAGAAEALAQEFGVRVHRDLAPALDDADTPLLDVCSPSAAHLDAIQVGLERGLPMLVEKPLVSGRGDLARLFSLLEGRAAPPLLAVVQNYRYYSSIGRALDRIAGGALGQLTSITGFAPTRFPVSWTRSTWLYDDGGVLLDFAPHALDLFVLFAAAPVRRVAAFGHDVSGGRMGFVNYAQVQVAFDAGVLASLDASWVTGSNMFTLGLHGTGGHIDIDVRSDAMREYHGTYTPFDDWRDFASRVGATARRLASGEFFRGPLVFYPQLFRELLAALGGAPPGPRLASLAQGLNSALALEAALQALAEGRVVEAEEIAGEAGMRVMAALYPAKA